MVNVLDRNRDCRLGEGGVDGVDGNGVVGVGGIAADIADNRELAVRRSE